MAEEGQKRVAARYLGPGGTLRGGPYYNADGTRRDTNVLNTGDVLLLPAQEVLGATYKREPNGQVFLLGAGKVVKPEHADRQPEELEALGYEFHEGRPDFEAVEATPAPEAAEEERHTERPAGEPLPAEQTTLNVAALAGTAEAPVITGG